MHEIANMFNSSHSVLFLYLISFIGGIIASISPCSLAMLPIIVGYVGGYSNEKPAKTFVQPLFFIIGSAIVFSIFGIFCAVTGKVFVSFAGGYFGLVMASIIMIMGLKLVGFLDFELPVIIKEMPRSESTNIYLYPLLLGGAVALASSLLLRYPAIYVTFGIQWLVNAGTTTVPFLMGIIVAMIMGMALTAPISSAAIAAMVCVLIEELYIKTIN